MVRPSLLAIPFAAALVSAGHYKRAPHKIKESIEQSPDDWLRHASAPLDHLLELTIALPQPHFRILEKHLYEISDPDHERYGAYLSKEETEELMAPHPETLDVVSEWLSSHGIEEEHLHRSSAQEWITIHVPVALAEEMLNTKYDIYTHLDSGESIVRTTNYSLPESLHEHIELIQPTTMFTGLSPFKSTLHWSSSVTARSLSSSTGTITGPAGNPVNASCNHTITLSCLRQMYNAVRFKPSSTNGNKIAVAAFVEQYANNKDLQQFFKLQNPAACGFTYTFVSINGGLNNQSYAAAGSEANMNTQFTFGLTYPTPAILYSTGGSLPYLPWLEHILSQKDPPQTITISYGYPEHKLSPSYAKLVCSNLGRLGARGVSILVSSGDEGVGDGNPDPASHQCFRKTKTGVNKTMFLPDFPASCPYVTSVGGTNYIPETAYSPSGGGFSNYFDRPDYQSKVVPTYLKNLPSGAYKGLYNRKGRGIPDVAAQAKDFTYIYKGRERRSQGTSCSAPAFAAFVSMLNDARIRAGTRPLGFLNPWLYREGYTKLNDITVGNNPGCGTQGFNATVGWDPVTGLGTPNFRELLTLATV